MAEYLSIGPLDANTAMWLRDAVQHDEVPDLKDLDNPKYFPYRWGQAFWAYVGGKFGDQIIPEIFMGAARGGPTGGIGAAIHESEKQFSQNWKRAMLDAERPILEATTPADREGRLLVSPKKHGGPYNVSPAISPDGKRMMFFSAKGMFSIELYEADAETGKVVRKITSTAVSPHFVNLEFVNSAGAWSNDGTRFAFASVRNGRAELAIFNEQQGRIVRRIPFTSFGEVLNPTWAPDGSEIAFSANAAGITDLFSVDVKTEKFRRLTTDAFADVQPAWSPRGDAIAFVTDRFTSDLSNLSMGLYRIGLLDVKSGNIRELTIQNMGSSMNPQWSPDGMNLYFLSDASGISNIYRVNLRNGAVAQVTNVQTGVSGVTARSPAFSTNS